MQDSTVLWLLIALFFLLAEMSNPGLFFFLAFCCGALAGMAGSMVALPLITQLWLFFGGTLLSLIILKFWVQKKLRHVRSTNVHALIGKKGFVMQTITAENPGLVKIGGETWSAKSLHEEQIPAGIQVEVVKVTGSYLIVEIL